MRKLILGLMGATALTFGATAANASVSIDAGTTVTVTGPNVQGGGVTFDFGYAQSTSGTPFTQWLNFTNTLGGVYSIDLTTIAGTAASDIDFTASATCPSCGFWLLGGATPIAIPQSAGWTDQNEVYHIDTGFLGAGSYQLKYVGYGSGSFGGSVSFAAVPEPATWGMMLLGFAGIGMAMRRSRRRNGALMQIA